MYQAGGVGRARRAAAAPRGSPVCAASTRPRWARTSADVGEDERGGRVGGEAVALDLGASARDELRRLLPVLLRDRRQRELREARRVDVGRRDRRPPGALLEPPDRFVVAARELGRRAAEQAGSSRAAGSPRARARRPARHRRPCSRARRAPAPLGRGTRRRRRARASARRRPRPSPPNARRAGPGRTRAGRSPRATASSGVATSSASLNSASQASTSALRPWLTACGEALHTSSDARWISRAATACRIARSSSPWPAMPLQARR